MSQSGIFLHRTTGFNLPRFGGGGASTQTVTQKADPWAGQQPYLTDVFAQAKNLYNAQGPNYFPTSTVAPMNSGQTDSLNNIYSVGSQGGTPALQAAQGNNTQTLNGDYLSAGNPYFSNMAQSVLGQVMPGIQAGFNTGNRLDSGLASRAAAMGATDALGGLAYQNYQDERGNQIKAQALAPGIDQSTLGDMNTGLQAAGAYQNQNQNELSDLVNRWNYGQQQPWQKLGMYGQSVAGNYGGTTQTQQPMYSNPTANILGGASALAGIGSGLFGSSGMFPGALATLFAGISDRRMKDDIRRIGTADNGLPIYAFRYKGSPQTLIGFMADEVEKLHPEAVHEHPAGFKMVNYAQAVT
jgi:Chaperone of endosialidase